MIKTEELKQIGLITYQNQNEWLNPGCDFLFEINTNRLYSYDEVDGSMEYYCEIKDLDHLIEMLWVIFKYY